MKSKNRKTLVKRSTRKYPVIEPDYTFKNIFEIYRDKHGFRVFWGIDDQGNIIFDINKIIFSKGRTRKKYKSDGELLTVYNHKPSFVLNPMELPDNIRILYQYSHSSHVRRWVFKRLNSIPIGNHGKTIGDFQIRTKNGYFYYNLENLNKEALGEN